ncbi:3-phosphoglycerate dehydrogenase [Rhizobiaceae bacterium BDR2-2]|uniref:3-phosphoglycerate dehydrogenase n=1 Tax=Ectorhizobium quercum TaxID=2965071 RepID=A0AAE3N1S6_9HYPH|nr:NAD(P)-dependent oxidoreductase [Ectorhizobium quercum]MCX8998371.1 3-phosphoglycerate dehydrogenase [Ectorhizobium quercum]
MKCLILQPVHENGLSLLREGGVEPVICPDARAETVGRLLPGCAAAITRDAGFPEAFFSAADALKVVVVHGAGHDAVDKEAASARGVLVCNSPGFNARSVSELALGLALAAARSIPSADRAERDGKTGFRERHVFSELSGKTALIVGFGATGAGLARMLEAALGMRVLVHSPRAPSVDGFERVDRLEDGLAQADLISLHTPMRPQTRGLIGEHTLSLIKPGAILVNTARAGLVDEAALARAIETGRIAAAGLDVYSHDAPSGPLAATDRVIFTPHLGGSTQEALKRTAIGAARNVLTALSGRTPATALNAPVGDFAPHEGESA